jgi:hypothetical protein
MRAARAVARVRARPCLAVAVAANRLSSSSSSSHQPQPPSPARDLEVGELQGAQFKIEPLRREGEDLATMRARLLCAFFPYPYQTPPFLRFTRASPDP